MQERPNSFYAVRIGIDMNSMLEENDMFAAETPSVEEAIEFAVQAIDRGDFKLGNAALDWVLQREPDNPIAWLWMACCLTDEEAKRSCYSRIS
jgi:Tfp pilus assembly protein PilF